jgi:hypothetical protein
MDHLYEFIHRGLAAIDRSETHVRFVVAGTDEEDDD